jgi:hypothetical protein
VGLVDGLVAHAIKLTTWCLALVADRLRGSANPIASPCLPLATIFFALSATYTLDWPPDYASALPVFQVLDIVLLYCFFIVTAWSAMGCMQLSESNGGLKLPVEDKDFEA